MDNDYEKAINDLFGDQTESPETGASVQDTPDAPYQEAVHDIFGIDATSQEYRDGLADIFDDPSLKFTQDQVEEELHSQIAAEEEKEDRTFDLLERKSEAEQRISSELNNKYYREAAGILQKKWGDRPLDEVYRTDASLNRVITAYADRIRQNDINNDMVTQKKQQIAEEIRVDDDIHNLLFGEGMSPEKGNFRMDHEFGWDQPVDRFRESFTRRANAFRDWMQEATEESSIRGAASWMADWAKSHYGYEFEHEVWDNLEEVEKRMADEVASDVWDAIKELPRGMWEGIVGEKAKPLEDVTQTEIRERARETFPGYIALTEELNDAFEAGEDDTLEYHVKQQRLRDMEDYIASGKGEELNPGLLATVGALMPWNWANEEGTGFGQMVMADPGGVISEFGQLMVADPQYALFGFGFAKGGTMTAARLHKKGQDVSTLRNRGKILMGQTGGAIVAGAALEAPTSVMRGLGSEDGLDWRTVGQDIGFMSGMGPLMGGAFYGVGRAFGAPGSAARAKRDVNKSWIEDRAQRIIDSKSVVDSPEGFRFRQEVDPNVTRQAYAQARKEAESLGIGLTPETSAPASSVMARAVNKLVEEGGIGDFISAFKDTRKVMGERNLPEVEFNRVQPLFKYLKDTLRPEPKGPAKSPTTGKFIPRRESFVAQELKPNKDVLAVLDDGYRTLNRKQRKQKVQDYIRAMRDKDTREEVAKTLPKEEQDAIRRSKMTNFSLATMGGLWIWANESESWTAAINGALMVGAGLTAATFVGRAMTGKWDFWEDIMRSGKDNPAQVRSFADEYMSMTSSMQLTAFRDKEHLIAAVPTPERRVAISRWLEGEDVRLSPEEQIAAEAIQNQFSWFAKVLKKEGLINATVDNYITHILEPMTAARTRAARGELRGAISEDFRFGKKRSFKTLKEAKKAGFVPKTEDIAEILYHYEVAASKAIAARRLVQGLKKSLMGDGTPAVVSRAKYKKQAKDVEAGRPSDYTTIEHPSLAGHLVHRDVKGLLDFFFQSRIENNAFRGISTINYLAKRSLVSLSLFHAQTLVESMIMAGHARKAPGVVAGTSPYLTLLRYGQSGDIVDVAVRGGVKFGIDDVGRWDTFYSNIENVGNLAREWANSGLLGAAVGKPLQKSAKVLSGSNRFVDSYMWDTVHTGAKLTVFAEEMSRLRLKYPNMPEKQLAEEVAGFVNDAFGGLDWYRLATRTSNEHLRRALMAAYSPKGREIMQQILFAPDWTISNLRILGKGAGGVMKTLGAALTGRARPLTIQEALSLNYGLRGSLYWAMYGNLINIGYTGRPIWQNDDPTMIDLGDGRRVTWSKQFWEPYNWVTNPSKTSWNKMSVAVKGPMEQAASKEWMGSWGGWGPPMFPEDAGRGERARARTSHIANKFNPIGIQQWIKDGDREALSAEGVNDFLLSIGGHPRYGVRKRRNEFELERIRDHYDSRFQEMSEKWITGSGREPRGN